MFDSDWRTEMLKAAIMLLVVGFEWWMMQPYHEPLLPRLWLSLARFCYSVARKVGSLGLTFEHAYFEAI